MVTCKYCNREYPEPQLCKYCNLMVEAVLVDGVPSTITVTLPEWLRQVYGLVLRFRTFMDSLGKVED